MMRSSLISCTSCATAMMRSLVNSSMPATTRSRFLHTCSSSFSSSINIMNKPSFSVSKTSTIHRDFCSSTTSVWNPERVTNLYILARGKKPPDPVKSKPGDRWLVGLKISGIEFLTEQQLFDFYVDVLASVLPIPSKEEARKKIYLVSCERPFGFGAKIDADSAYELNYRADRFFLVEDHYYGARNKDPSQQSTAKFIGLNWNHRLDDIYSYYHLSNLKAEWNHDHWIVHLKFPDCEFANALDVFHYCVQLLAKAVGSKKEAKNKVYAVWWKSPFGFCAEIDEDSSIKLKVLQDVLEVLPDYSFDAKSKCANGEVLLVGPPAEGKSDSRFGYIYDNRDIYDDEDMDHMEGPVSVVVDRGGSRPRVSRGPRKLARSPDKI